MLQICCLLLGIAWLSLSIWAMKMQKQLNAIYDAAAAAVGKDDYA